MSLNSNAQLRWISERACEMKSVLIFEAPSDWRGLCQLTYYSVIIEAYGFCQSLSCDKNKTKVDNRASRVLALIFFQFVLFYFTDCIIVGMKWSSMRSQYTCLCLGPSLQWVPYPGTVPWLHLLSSFFGHVFLPSTSSSSLSSGFQ